MMMTLILFGTALAGCLGTTDSDETELNRCSCRYRRRIHLRLERRQPPSVDEGSL
jgi:hypothetical protein